MTFRQVKERGTEVEAFVILQSRISPRSEDASLASPPTGLEANCVIRWRWISGLRLNFDIQRVASGEKRRNAQQGSIGPRGSPIRTDRKSGSFVCNTIHQT